ncbi:hypothetical protein STEG23_017645 [Scotinomys teguina]
MTLSRHSGGRRRGHVRTCRHSIVIWRQQLRPTSRRHHALLHSDIMRQRRTAAPYNKYYRYLHILVYWGASHNSEVMALA